MSDWLREKTAGGPRRIGQLTITRLESGYRLEGPPGEAEPEEWPGDADRLRERVRHTDAGRYRPLRGARDLPAGWFCLCPDADVLAACIEAVYPLALTHLQQAETRTLRVIPITETFRRQAGRYAAAGNLDDDGRRRARAVLCSRCVRTPVWAGDAMEGDGAIPCPEACSVMMALCRAMVKWNEAERPDAPPDEEAGFAEFDNPRHPWRYELGED